MPWPLAMEKRRAAGFSEAAPGPQIAGNATYTGLARVGGCLEVLGRRRYRYTPPEIGHWMADGETLPFGGGLRVLHLPGHTPGHCGFYSAAMQLFLAGDLFANFLGWPQVPPRIFSENRRLACESIVNADRDIPADAGVVLNHGRDADPARHRADLAWLARSLSS